ncbi:hypothetical protein DYBT9275_01845 [Dyadobacter sp. CECT 9275]|uniref:Gliding motility-associated C-terminal domain-containing protein n=1 Tax=Dyadobacter helix TaxID=2822344 RepID=A0A916JA63_9BACT|nr:gliding motility-associated C-terminal domain-containing protein [Dyadobacter sp. CECT 9275]CAG4997758.1 hypothetical protein DYBT9275_01845 [Dyadobacter sp. CECT 9275]
MKYRFTFLILLLLAFCKAQATHIVGGQLFIKANSNAGNIYTLGLTMYFDALNGNPGAEDAYVNIYVFRKRDNAAVGYVQAPKIERKSVTYSNPTCGISTLQTYMITYAIDARLEISAFSDPQGYYMVWDRCCRNGTITNIQAPGDAGSIFYLEFPPIVKNNTAYLNSSPVFPAIQGDYACVNTPFNFDFGGTDADGDSLTYTLVTPRQGFSNKDNPSAPAIGSSSYPRLTWVSGISEANIIPGPRPLTVNPRTGMLSVTPGNVGLYVFAVQVDEYRNGSKIGTLTRDFQLKVVDCPKSDPPKLMLRPKGSSTFYTENQILTVKSTDPNCFEVMVTDPTANQLISISGETINANKNYFSILPAELKTTLGNDTLKFEVCLDDCFITYDNRPLRIQLVAEDESCPIPLSDTLTIFIRRENNANNAPAITTSLTSDYVHVSAGSPVSFIVYGKDTDQDNLTLSGKGRDFALTSYAMDFKNATGKGSVQQNFNWTPPCNAKKGDTLAVDFSVNDMRCEGNPLTKSKTVYFIVDQSPNNPPSITTSLPEVSVSYALGTSGEINFDVIGSDIDTNTISVTAQGRGFDMRSLGMTFSGKSGTSKVIAPYSWNPDCALLEGSDQKTFTVDFMVSDKSCTSSTDTISVNLTISDSEKQEMPEIPNVITPNGDGKNDCLVLEDLPADNCAEQFKDVTVFNRWGKQIYYSKVKQNWCPTNLSGGYYYYVIRYTSQSVKGGLTLLK